MTKTIVAVSVGSGRKVSLDILPWTLSCVLIQFFVMCCWVGLANVSKKGVKVVCFDF